MPWGRLTGSPGRRALLAAVAMILAPVVMILAAPASAGAHIQTGTVAVDYRASVLRPVTSAYRAGIYQSDRGLNLRVARGHVVVLLGYLGEPVFRLKSTRLWVNAASPTAVSVGLLKRDQRASGTVAWVVQPGRSSVAWHDGRARGLPPGVMRGVWRVPLVVDGRQMWLQGVLRREPKPSLWPWLAAFVGLVAVAIGPALVRRTDLERVRAAAVWWSVVVAAASVLVTVGFVLDAYASPGMWIEGVDEVVFLAVGVGALAVAPRNWQAGAAVGIGLVGAAAGISKGSVFMHPIVLAVLPGALIRVLVVVAAGAGLAVAALGGWYYVIAPAPAAGGDGSGADDLDLTAAWDRAWPAGGSLDG